jgi:LmbE family N-acetylglucosaminyl deacetylase
MSFGSRVLLTVLLALLAAFAPIRAAQNHPRTLLLLLAHADDETAAAPALAKYSREGVRIYMVIATDGSGGSGTQANLVRPENGPTGDALVKARAEEARCAASALHATEPTLLAFPDGKLGDYLGDRTLIGRLTDEIAKQVATLHPDVVVTWGPDGGTAHPDHRIVSDIATQLLRSGAPGMPDRLFYMYIPAAMFKVMNPQRGAPPMVLPQARYFTMNVPFTPADGEAALSALACHKTQMTPEVLARARSEFEQVWAGSKVPFVPASSSMKGDDLFR